MNILNKFKLTTFLDLEIVKLLSIQSIFVFLNKKTTDALFLKEFSGSLHPNLLSYFFIESLIFSTSLTSTYT